MILGEDHSKVKCGRVFLFCPKFILVNLCQRFLIKSVVSKLYAMSFYDKITDSEGLDTSEGTDIICAGVVSCKWCDFCHFLLFSKTKTLNISLMLAMVVMTLLYMLNC